MVVMGFLKAVLGALKALFSWINLPAFDDETFNNVLMFLDTLFTNAQELINLFLPWDIVRFGIPVVIIVVNFEHIYDLVMWVLRKIPMLGIE